MGGKNKLIILLVAICLSISVSGCKFIGLDGIKEDTTKEEREEDKYTFSQEDKKNLSVIQTLINKQMNTIRTNNIKEYIETLDKSKLEYIAEKKAWFRDINLNDITDLEIKIKGIDVIDNGTILAKLNQSYTFNNKNYSISYINKYKRNNNRWLDSDLNFKVIETEHFIIKYPIGEEEIARIISEAAEKGYSATSDKLGIMTRDKTVIKLYDNLELLRQSVKLSFSWQFAGWYEYPESIKIGLTNKVRSVSTDRLKQINEKIVAHELTHKITITKSNNNLPYWFSEGLATYYTVHHNKDIDKYENINNLWAIERLEKENLETMTDNDNIKKYYKSSGLIATFIAEKYGEDTLLKIVNKLGEYNYEEGTGIEVDAVSIERFHKAIKEVMGITVEELDQQWKEYKNRD